MRKRKDVSKTGLSLREEAILSSIVEYYITYGEPVGSKQLVTALPFAVSSATVRNEMAYLSELGLLEQPHTSAGRIPADAGFRYYVDKLMPRLSPSNAEMFRITSSLDHTQGDPARLLGDACELLSELTGTAAVATTPYAAGAVITGVQAVPVSEKTAMVVVTTSAGVLKSRAAKLPEKADYSLYELFYNVAAANFLNTPAEAVTRAKLQTVVSSLGAHALQIMPLLICLYDAVNESLEADVIKHGHNLLHSQPGLRETASSILRFADDEEAFEELLRSGRSVPVSVRIGAENGYAFMRGASVVTAGYKAGANDAGVIGIIGSSSMDYSHVIPLVEYMSEAISLLLKEDNDS